MLASYPLRCKVKVLTPFQPYCTGHIPHHIGKLVNLSSLQLQSNHLTGSVPESLGDLILLEDLNLSSNNLKGRNRRT
jgi:Leucine-rich repeat (LRR) protein